MATAQQPDRPPMSDEARPYWEMLQAIAKKRAAEAQAARIAELRERARTRGWRVGPTFRKSDSVWEVLKVVQQLHDAGYFAVLVPVDGETLQVEYRATTALLAAPAPVVDALREGEGFDADAAHTIAETEAA